MRLTGKKALLFGAAGGIGTAVFVGRIVELLEVPGSLQ